MASMVLAGACSGQRAAAPSTNDAVGATTSATAPQRDDTWEPSRSCSDEQIAKRLDASFAAAEPYFRELAQHAQTWRGCDDARGDLIALEADASRFQQATRDLAVWADGNGPPCRSLVQRRGADDPRARAMSEQFTSLGAALSLVTRCKSEPGFAAAIEKGFPLAKREQHGP